MLNIPMGDPFAALLVAGHIDYDGVYVLPNAYVLEENGFPVAPDGILVETAVYEKITDVDTVEAGYKHGTVWTFPGQQL
jgi:hypothetical protein